MTRTAGLRQLESWISWIRLLAVPIAVFQVEVAYPEYPPGHELAARATTAMLALGAVVIFWLARRPFGPRGERGLAVAALAFDTAIVATYFFIYTFDAGRPITQLAFLPLAEAAVRFGARGAFVWALALLPLLAASEWWRSTRFPPHEFVLNHVSLSFAVALLLGLLVGWLADRLRSRADALERSLVELSAERERAERLARWNQLVLDTTIDGFLLLDRDGDVVLANRAAEALAELQRLPGASSVADARAQAHLITDPDGYREALARLTDGAATPFVFGYELRDSGRSVQVHATPVPEGADATWVLTLRDVTAERQAEKLKTEVVATVSHELRTPLTGILGFADLLARRELDSQTARRYGETIAGEASRLAALVDDLLDLQRIESGDLALSDDAVDLRALLREQVARFAEETRAHVLELEVPEHPLVVRGDRARVEQIVANLLSNAIKYSPAGGRVDVSAKGSGPAVRVAVTDEGIGIPADQQGHVFEKFFRADSSDTRTIYGTGLGLALARELVESQGGRIGFESVEEKGSTFWFELPAASAA